MTREEADLHRWSICAACRFGTHSPEFVQELKELLEG